VEIIVKKVHNFELAHVKKKKERKKERKHFGRLVTFWFGTFVVLFCTTGYVVLLKTLEDERYILVKAYSLPFVTGSEERGNFETLNFATGYL